MSDYVGIHLYLQWKESDKKQSFSDPALPPCTNRLLWFPLQHSRCYTVNPILLLLAITLSLSYINWCSFSSTPHLKISNQSIIRSGPILARYWYWLKFKAKISVLYLNWKYSIGTAPGKVVRVLYMLMRGWGSVSVKTNAPLM